jgi:hypothetical protein
VHFDISQMTPGFVIWASEPRCLDLTDHKAVLPSGECSSNRLVYVVLITACKSRFLCLTDAPQIASCNPRFVIILDQTYGH